MSLENADGKQALQKQLPKSPNQSSRQILAFFLGFAYLQILLHRLYIITSSWQTSNLGKFGFIFQSWEVRMKMCSPYLFMSVTKGMLHCMFRRLEVLSDSQFMGTDSPAVGRHLSVMSDKHACWSQQHHFCVILE